MICTPVVRSASAVRSQQNDPCLDMGEINESEGLGEFDVS